MFFDGVVGAIGWGEPDSREHLDHGHAFARQTGFGLGDYGETYRCGGKSSGRGCGDVPEVRGGGGEGMSGVEGAERQDYDEGEAGVGTVSGFRYFRNVNHEGHEGSRRRSLTSWFDTWRHACRI